MFKRSKISMGVLLALSGAVVLPAMAQDAQRIEITGSRIKTVATEGTSPVVSLGVEAIKVEAVRDVESLLNNLPQVFADQGGQVSNGSTGTATVNLRNFGSTRTLVLVNGRRLPAGSPLDSSTDLNQIPISLVKRVDVLTGGASAIYGSDAVAGVVNFIMNDKFEGVQLDLNHQFFNHQQHNAVADVVRARGFVVPGDKDTDGKSTDFNLTLGGNFGGGKGNATVFVAHKQQAALLQSERDFTACALGGSNAKWACGGSSTSFPGRFITDAGNLTVADAAGNTRPWVAATDIYNYGPLNYLQRPSDRYTAAAFAHYDISDMARVYSELSFHDDHTVAQIAPSGLFGFDASGVNAIKFENPLLSADWKAQLGLNAPGDTAEMLILRRNVEGGGRQDDLRHTSFRGVIGIKGDLNPNWSYDAAAQVGKVIYQETYKNDFSIARTARAMDVVTDPATGEAVCRSKLDGTDPNCVPYNLWALGKITPEATGYLSTPGFQKGFTGQAVTTLSLNGDLTQYGIKSPLAKNGMGIAFGAERRTEELDFSTDVAFSSGDLAGQGGPRIGLGGKYSVTDYFGEMRFPLMEGRPMAELLNLTASYRHSSYSTNHNTDTYGAGLEWVPVKTVKVRGSYQQAARAANVIELFQAQAVGLYDNDADPCATATPTATLEQCARTGVTAAQYGNIVDSAALQYNALFGGNPNLKPETSKSYTLGLVLSPMRDLSVTVDYFNMKVKDVIGTLPAPTVLQQCLTTGDPFFCSLITRDRLGTLWATPQARIVATNLNLGFKKSDGVDLGFDYALKVAALGKLDFSYLGTFLNKFEAEDVPGLGSYDCAGLYGNTCGTPLPKWRHKLRTTWSTPWNAAVALTWRHLDSVEHDTTSSNPLLGGTTPAVARTLGARNYLDLAASYNVTKHLTVRAAINNLFDRDPPLISGGAGFANGNTYPVVYDSEGRRISLNLVATF